MRWNTSGGFSRMLASIMMKYKGLNFLTWSNRMNGNIIQYYSKKLLPKRAVKKSSWVEFPAFLQLTPWPPLFSREGVTRSSPCLSPSLGERGGRGWVGLRAEISEVSTFTLAFHSAAFRFYYIAIHAVAATQKVELKNFHIREHGEKLEKNINQRER